MVFIVMQFSDINENVFDSDIEIAVRNKGPNLKAEQTRNEFSRRRWAKFNLQLDTHINSDSRDVTNCRRSVKVEWKRPLNTYATILRTIFLSWRKAHLNWQAYLMTAEHTNRRQVRRSLSCKLVLYMQRLMRARREKYIEIISKY